MACSRVDDVFWGYRPAWAAQAVPAPGKKKIPIAINARLEKLAGAYWKPLLRAGRGIVCVSGWYEWTGEKGTKQPWHIHRRDRAPLFLLALAQFGPYKLSREEAGFVLVTADSLGGMVDIHDRRPVAVSLEDAHRWLDPRAHSRASAAPGAQLHARRGAVRMACRRQSARALCQGQGAATGSRRKARLTGERIKAGAPAGATALPWDPA